MFFDKLISFFSSDIAIDLGTANTLIWVKNQGIILNQPSVVALNKKNRKIIAVGTEAKKMLGKTPHTVEAIRPMKDGVIADFHIAEEMIRIFIKKSQPKKAFIHPRIVICVPSGITEVEKRAVHDAAISAGAREVYLVQEPIAAAIGVDLPVFEPYGNMIIDIGGGTTEIAVIALSGIVCNNSVRVGGDKMDEAIINFLKKNYNLAIGDQTAEYLKINIASAFPLKEEKTITVKGRDVVAGLPKTMTINSEEIRGALNEPVNTIVEAVRDALEKTPPELSADIVERGVFLTGGGAMLHGLDQLLREETNLPINLVQEPLLCVVKGTGMILENFKYYQNVLMKSEKV